MAGAMQMTDKSFVQPLLGRKSLCHLSGAVALRGRQKLQVIWAVFPIAHLSALDRKTGNTVHMSEKAPLLGVPLS